MNRSVYIPIETKVRELQAKVLLACVIAESGRDCIIGEISEVRDLLETEPPGIFMAKSITHRFAERYQRYKQYGHKITAWDEEGLVVLKPEDYQKSKVSEEALRHVDVFFAWGLHQKEMIVEKVPEAREKVRLTGNPRFDVLEPDLNVLFNQEVDAIQNIWGKYILLNGTFGVYNHYLGFQQAKENLRQAQVIRSDSEEEFYEEYYEFDRRQFEVVQDAVKELSRRFSDVAIIVRPHPSEDHNRWREFAQGIQNVFVVHEGSVIPWILGSEVMFHCGCMTGVEALLLQRRALAFRPVHSEVYEPYLPIALNEQVHDIGDLVDKISESVHQARSGAILTAAQEEIARRYIANYGKCLASDCIASELGRLDNEDGESGDKQGSSDRVNRGWRRAKRLIKAWINRRPVVNTYKMQKFPSLSLVEVQSCVDSFKGATNRFENVSVDGVKGTRTCFRVSG